jgi:hypothetical protein
LKKSFERSPVKPLNRPERLRPIRSPSALIGSLNCSSIPLRPRISGRSAAVAARRGAAITLLKAVASLSRSRMIGRNDGGTDSSAALTLLADASTCWLAERSASPAATTPGAPLTPSFATSL